MTNHPSTSKMMMHCHYPPFQTPTSSVVSVVASKFPLPTTVLSYSHERPTTHLSEQLETPLALVALSEWLWLAHVARLPLEREREREIVRKVRGRERKTRK